jgi:hypothetical protein
MIERRMKISLRSGFPAYQPSPLLVLLHDGFVTSDPDRLPGQYRAGAPGGAGQPESILRQNVNLAKLFLNLLDAALAAGTSTSFPCAHYRRPAILAGHDRNVRAGSALIERP